jgi:hypothetical protein
MGKTVKKISQQAKDAANKAKKAAEDAKKKARDTVTAGANVAQGATKASIALGKGDIKGAAKEGLKTVDIAKNFTKSTAAQQAGILASSIKGAGALSGSKDISNLGTNVGRESKEGINKYGDVAMDVAANSATGGTYGLAKQAATALAQGGISGALQSAMSPDQIKQLALRSAGSYAGVDPVALAAAKNLASGKGIQDAALGAAGDYTKLDPNVIKATQAIAAGKDLKNTAMDAAGEKLGAGKEALKVAKSVASGKGIKEGIESQVESQALAASGLDKDNIEAINQAKSLSTSGLKNTVADMANEKAGMNLQNLTNKNKLKTMAGNATGINPAISNLRDTIGGVKALAASNPLEQQMQNMTESQIADLKKRYGV